MYFSGLLIGLFSFISIGVFHPIVIKGEYYFSSRIWPIFLVLGITFLMVSIMLPEIIQSSICGVLGFTCLWTIKELKEQEERVNKGWFPSNPKKNKRK